MGDYKLNITTEQVYLLKTSIEAIEEGSPGYLHLMGTDIERFLER